MKKAIIMLCACLPIAGCITQGPDSVYLYKAHTTQKQKYEDMLACDIQAAKTIPPNTQVDTIPGYGSPVYSIGDQIFGGRYYGGSTYSYDANGPLRREVRSQCIAKKGYKILPAKLCNSWQSEHAKPYKGSDKVEWLGKNQCIVPLGRLAKPLALAHPSGRPTNPASRVSVKLN